jgi:mRNA-degrading endonuclease RelE of RelBE toxin-antitoxin system
MSWRIRYFSSAQEAFEDPDLNITKPKTRNLARKAIRAVKGHKTNVELKKLKGSASDLYRIRTGDIRIIISFDFDSNSVIVRRIKRRKDTYDE